MPKTGIEPISKSYKEFILPIKLFRPLPWERIELTYLYLQNSALTTKQPRLYIYYRPYFLFYYLFLIWRKIDSNYHICSANTTDYHYQISPFLSFLYYILYFESLLIVKIFSNKLTINILKVIVKLMFLI